MRKKLKRKRNDLGKVVSFASQEVKEYAETESSENKNNDNIDLENQSRSKDAV